MKTEEVISEWGDLGNSVIKITNWSVSKELCTNGNTPKIIFMELLLAKIPIQSIINDYFNIDTNNIFIVIKIEFYFRYSYVDGYSQPFNPTIRPLIRGSFLFSKKKKIKAFQLFIENCPDIPGNFHTLKYFPTGSYPKDQGSLIDKYIENQRKFEKEFEKEFLLM